jgi:hypothetical protein
MMRKAGGPDRHDEQKVQCANGHGSILEICSPVAIWAVGSPRLRYMYLSKSKIEGRIDTYIEHRLKFLRDENASRAAGSDMATSGLLRLF